MPTKYADGYGRRVMVSTLEDFYLAMEEGMANHAGILAWRIPWVGKPGGLQSGGCTESDLTKVT